MLHDLGHLHGNVKCLNCGEGLFDGSFWLGFCFQGFVLVNNFASK